MGPCSTAGRSFPRKMRAQLRTPQPRGIEIVIVTGRRFHSARMVAEQLGCDVSLIVSNGALIKSTAGDTHYRQLLPAGTARQVLDATAEFRPSAGVIFDRPFAKQVVFEHVDWDKAIRGGLSEAAPAARSRNRAAHRMSGWRRSSGGSLPWGVQKKFGGQCDYSKSFPLREFGLALTEYEHRNLSMLDVLRRGVNKGVALAEWARQRGIPRADVMAIGDNWNDREMLEYAGLPVVMGNSVQELKSLGWSVTLSNDESGVAAAISEHALRDPITR